MTCSKDCKNCMFGTPIGRVECKDPGVTCAGNCYECEHAHKTITFICKHGIDARKEGPRHGL